MASAARCCPTAQRDARVKAAVEQQRAADAMKRADTQATVPPAKTVTADASSKEARPAGSDQRAAAAATGRGNGRVMPRERKVATQACRRAGETIALPGWYTVARGDSLWKIANRHYRHGERYPIIVAANRRRIDNEDLIQPCQRFWLPKR